MSSSNRVRICIEELLVNAYLGVHTVEQKKLRQIPVDVEFEYEAPHSDSLLSALDYREIRNKILAAVENNRFALIETMARTIVEAVATEPRVMRVTVRVSKTKALKQARSVDALVEWIR